VLPTAFAYFETQRLQTKLSAFLGCGAHVTCTDCQSHVSRNNRKVRTSFCPASPATNRPVPSRPPRNLPGAARPRCGSQALLRRSREAAFIKLLDSLGRVGKFLRTVCATTFSRTFSLCCSLASPRITRKRNHGYGTYTAVPTAQGFSGTGTFYIDFAGVCRVWNFCTARTLKASSADPLGGARRQRNVRGAGWDRQTVTTIPQGVRRAGRRPAGRGCVTQPVAGELLFRP
jgi:hypothetical protein